MKLTLRFGLAVLRLVTLSCAGPEEKRDLTPEEIYFEELDLVSSETSKRLEPLFPSFQSFALDGGGRSIEENEQLFLAQVGPNLPAIIESYKARTARLSNVSPPDNLIEGHQIRIEASIAQTRALEEDALPAYMANDFAAVEIAAAKRSLLNRQVIRDCPQHYCLAWTRDRWPCYPGDGVPGGA
jgi:hypothetical protein